MSYGASMPPDELITPAQAVPILGQSLRTVQRLAETGELPVVQKLPGPNGAYLLRRKDVERLAAARAKSLAS